MARLESGLLGKSILMVKPFKFLPATLAEATVDEPYIPASVGKVTGGVPPYTFSAISGLPMGMGLSAFGILSGTPTADGSFTITFRVTDSRGATVLASCGIRVTPQPSGLPDLIYTTPSDNPAAPGDVFSPPVSAIFPPNNRPAISTLTESGIPGDTLVASGDQFNSDIKLTFYGQTTSGNGTTIDGTQKRLVAASNLLASRISASHVANSMYLAWPVNSVGTGYPVAVNKTELWWAGVSRNATFFNQSNFGLATQQSVGVIGDICRVHGRHLSTTATSTSSVAIGTGSKSFTTQTGLNYQTGDNIFVNSDSSALLGTMAGTVTSYNSGSGALVVNVTSITGSGTGTKWNICNSWIYLKPVGVAGQFITPTLADPFCVEYTIPSGISPGSSATSYTMATGSNITFTVVESSLGYTAGLQLLFVANILGGSSKGTMTATVVSYNSGTKQLVVNITAVSITSGTGVNVTPWMICPQFEIWCHNGHGGVRGWGGPITTTLIAAETYLGSGTNSVTLGAPTGGDDAGLFNTAIATIQGNGGSGTINVPAGTYSLHTSPNSISSGFGLGIWVKGAGKGSTIINTTSGLSATYALNLARTSKLSDMTINVDAAATLTNGAVSASWMENVDITSLNINTVKFATYISGCTLTGAASGSTVVVPQDTVGDDIDLTVLGCTFNVNNSCESAIFSFRGKRYHIVDCITQDLNVSGTVAQHGSGRMFVGQLSGLQTQYYFSRNKTITLAPDPNGGDQNKGEQFLWDGESGIQSSMVASATSNTITYMDTKSAGFSYITTTIFITSGKGLLQHAIVTGESGKTLTLDRNFSVIPDATSRVNITWGPTRLVMYNNNQQGNNNYASLGQPNGTASQGFETNGGSDVVYKGNTLTNGFQFAWSLFNGSSTTPCAIPLYGFLIEGNTVTKSNNGSRIIADSAIASEAFTAASCIQRRNVHTQCIDSEWVIFGGAVDMCIWENNQFSDATRGLYQYDPENLPNFINLQIYDSTFSLGTGTFAGSKARDIGGTAISLDEQPASGQFVGFQA